MTCIFILYPQFSSFSINTFCLFVCFSSPICIVAIIKEPVYVALNTGVMQQRESRSYTRLRVKSMWMTFLDAISARLIQLLDFRADLIIASLGHCFTLPHIIKTKNIRVAFNPNYRFNFDLGIHLMTKYYAFSFSSSRI